MTTDHLGSPRVVTDERGSVRSRRDFTAFGEESFTAQRTQGLGYQPTEVRKDYTGYEKDEESGLEFAQARYYNATHGRFTSVDPLTASATIRNPQTFNRYSYGLNSPYKFTDPLGLLSQYTTGACGGDCPNSDGSSGGWTSDYYSGQLNGPQQLAMRALELIAKGILPTVAFKQVFGGTYGKSQTSHESVQSRVIAGVVQTLRSVAARSVAQSNPLLATVLAGDTLGYVAGAATPIYNCLAWGLRYSDRWIQPGKGGKTTDDNTGPLFSIDTRKNKWTVLSDGKYTPQTAPSPFAIHWEYSWTPPGFYRIRVFENERFPGKWHVMLQEFDGTWSSKNGRSYLFGGIKDPDVFYRISFPFPGKIDTTDYILYGGNQW